MKHTDPVMKELWAAKDANAAKFGSAADYLAFLRKSEQCEHKARLKLWEPTDVERSDC